MALYGFLRHEQHNDLSTSLYPLVLCFTQTSSNPERGNTPSVQSTDGLVSIHIPRIFDGYSDRILQSHSCSFYFLRHTCINHCSSDFAAPKIIYRSTRALGINISLNETKTKICFGIILRTNSLNLILSRGRDPYPSRSRPSFHHV